MSYTGISPLKIFIRLSSWFDKAPIGAPAILACGGRERRFMRQCTLVSDFLQHCRPHGPFGSEAPRPRHAPCACRCPDGEKASFSFRRHCRELGDGVHVARCPVASSGDAQFGAADPVGIMDIDSRAPRRSSSFAWPLTSFNMSRGGARSRKIATVWLAAR